MTGLTLGFVGAVAVTGIVASFVVQHSGQGKLREKAEASRQQAEQIGRLSAENERLSNLLAHNGSSDTLSPEQLRELLRLRGQIGLLRQTAREQADLEAANEQLRAARVASEEQLAAARAAPNFWAKDQLAFAGYAEPEAALKTLLWAMSNGDVKSYLACWVSGDDINPLFGGELQDAAGAKMLTDTLAPSAGFHILDRKDKSPDQVILNLSFDGEGKARKFVEQRIGGEWKVADMLPAGEDVP
ncbi:MAG: hypothetical protein ACLQU3_08590 [Limisphaerales bacterium]